MNVEKALQELANRQRPNVPQLVIPRQLKTLVRVRRAVLIVGGLIATTVLLSGVFAMAAYLPSGDPAPPASAPNPKEPLFCFDLRTSRDVCPGVRLSLDLPKRHIRSGDSFTGRLVFTNNRDEAVIVDAATQPEAATFHRVKTGQRVGGARGWYGTGWQATLESGESAGIGLIVTAVRLRNKGNTPDPLQPGRYEIRATTLACDPREGGSCRPYPYATTRIRVKKAANS